MKALREYQEAATQATFDYFTQSSGHPLIIAPVAAGKSLLMAEVCRRGCSLYPSTRILVMAHNKELLVQNEAELKEQWPDVETGFYCAGLGRKKTSGQVIFASIQSIYNDIFKHKSFDLVLVDECHLISPNEDSMYRKAFKDLATTNPKVKIIGYTGTPYRSDTGLLVDGDLFNDVAYEIEIEYLIKEGFLCPPITPHVETKMDTSGVKMRGGDYIESQLEAAVNTDKITNACVDEIMALGAERKSWLIFTCGIKHCEAVCEAIQARGVSCAMVTGKTPSKERERILDAYKAGEIRCMVNVAVLTTGFNHPAIDLIAFMRPTRSPVLYVQCIGRGMRIHPDKKDVMVLDFGGVIDELGPIDRINITKKAEGGDGEAPMKQCGKCYAFVHAAAKTCEECGYEFIDPDGEPNIEGMSAKGQALLASQMSPETHKVLWMNTSRHEKPGKTPSMKVSYGTAQKIFMEWVCFEHKGFARSKAEEWHRKRYPSLVPDTVDDALKLEYPKPYEITVRKNGKYWEIIGYDFYEPEQEEEDEYEIPW